MTMSTVRSAMNALTAAFLVLALAATIGMTPASAEIAAAGLRPVAGSVATPVRCGPPCVAPIVTGPHVNNGPPPACTHCRYPKGYLPTSTRPGQSCVIKKVYCSCGPEGTKSYQPMCLYPVFLPSTH